MFQQLALWIVIILIVWIIVLEAWYPNVIKEGFEQLVQVGDSAFWAKWMPRRGDVGSDALAEEPGYIRDIRYYNGYTDVQRLGVNHDFCRMVQVKSDPTDMFFACALGGTEGLSTVRYRSQSIKNGFQLSRDDYMNSLGNGRNGYCRILKTGISQFEPKCNEADDKGFTERLTLDTNPPADIQLLLQFYQGIVFWIRMRDDLLDYAHNLAITTAGGLKIDEKPNPQTTEGLEFNGVDQYMRIGDNKSLEFGNIVQLTYLRAISFWVYFEEFTNNAHILDFGNGAGKDNVWVGIAGRGNASAGRGDVTGHHRSKVVCSSQDESTVPDAPSGAQEADEVTPKELMETTPANVDEYQCEKPEVFGAIVPHIQPKVAKPHEATTADLIYEVWDHQQRKMHIQVKNAIPLRKWVHVTITAMSGDAFRPNIAIYVNGSLEHVEEGGWLPQNNYTTHNYIGASNWKDVTSPYENADELFKGKMFDVRGYEIPMSEQKITHAVQWGAKMLGLKEPQVDNSLKSSGSGSLSAGSGPRRKVPYAKGKSKR